MNVTEHALGGFIGLAMGLGLLATARTAVRLVDYLSLPKNEPKGRVLRSVATLFAFVALWALQVGIVLLVLSVLSARRSFANAWILGFFVGLVLTAFSPAQRRRRP